MTLTLRPYQTQLINDIRAKWDSGAQNVLAVMPTGAGKTVTFAALNADGVCSCTIVHRQELVGQISKTYALTGIYHNIIAPQSVINFCIRMHIAATGRNFYDPRATVSVAGVDTLIRRFKPGDSWCNSIRRWTLDEAHHGRQEINGAPPPRCSRTPRGWASLRRRAEAMVNPCTLTKADCFTNWSKVRECET